MAGLKFLNLIALSSLAVLTASFGATPVAAGDLSPNHLGARHAHHIRGHDSFAKRSVNRRSDSVRCKARTTSSSSAAAQDYTSSPEVAAVATTSSTEEEATPTSTSSSAASEDTASVQKSSGNTWGKTGLAWPNGDYQDISLFKPKNGGTCVKIFHPV
jgi:hypothetical protein